MASLGCAGSQHWVGPIICCAIGGWPMSQSQDDGGDISRRSFVGTLAVGTAAGAATVASTGCAGLLPSLHGSGPEGEFDATAFLAQLDEGLAAIDRGSILERAVGSERLRQSARAHAFVTHREPIAKRAIRSLFAAGLYRNLPEHGRTDSRIEERKQALAPELDQSVSEITAMLASMTPEAHAQVRDALERNPDAVAKISEVFGERGATLHVPLSSRAKLRAAATDITFRLRKQPPELLIHECVGKVERLAARRGLELVVQQQVAAHAMQSSFWDDPAGGSWAAGQSAIVAPPPAPETPTPSYRRAPQASEPLPAPAERPARPGSGAIRTGLYIGGVGLLVFGISGLVVAAGGFEGVFGMTLGAVLVLVGLIVLLVGGIISASADPTPSAGG